MGCKNRECPNIMFFRKKLENPDFRLTVTAKIVACVYRYAIVSSPARAIK